MAQKIEDNLARLGITLPEAPPPAANYLPYTVSGNLVFVAGQLPMQDGKLAATGKVGSDITTQEAAGLARLCAINLLAQAKAAAGGDLSRVRRVVKLGGFVACTDSFTEQPEVINGASDLMVEVFGEAGRHARFAVGTNVLPRNVPVEIDAIFELQEK